MKVKKIFSVITMLVVILALALTGCAKQANEGHNGVETKVEETADAKTSTEENIKNDKTENTGNGDWRQFLKEYELWIDDYISFMKKYTENPKDASLIADYAEFMSKLSEWGEKNKNIENSLKDASPNDIREYYETLSKIIKKLDALNE